MRYYVYFPSGTLLYSIEAADNSRHFYHFDEMGNTLMLTSDTGAMTDSYSVTPYGENADHIGTTRILSPGRANMASSRRARVFTICAAGITTPPRRDLFRATR